MISLELCQVMGLVGRIFFCKDDCVAVHLGAIYSTGGQPCQVESMWECAVRWVESELQPRTKRVCLCLCLCLCTCLCLCVCLCLILQEDSPVKCNLCENVLCDEARVSYWPGHKAMYHLTYMSPRSQCSSNIVSFFPFSTNERLSPLLKWLKVTLHEARFFQKL